MPDFPTQTIQGLVLADTTQQYLPKAKRQRTNRSKCAFKYSHPIGTIKGISHRALKNTDKSGLTPVSPSHPHPASLTPTRAQRERFKDRVRKYQTQLYYGFTMAELEQMGAVAHLDPDRDTDDDDWVNVDSVGWVDVGNERSQLRCPLHPLFERKRWEVIADIPAHRGPIPMRGDADVNWDPKRGYWLAENPVVWKVLRPCLVLASKIMYKAYNYPWWDALINDTPTIIPLERCPPTHRTPRAQATLLNIRQRSPQLASSPEAMAKVEERLFDKAPPKIRLRLYSGYENPRTGLAMTGLRWYAVTGRSNGEKHMTVNIGLESLQPLLRDDLEPGERLACQFKVAHTITHEMAHATWISMEPEFGFISPYEPFFDDENISELGFSLTNTIFQGEPQEIFQHHVARGGPGLPSLGVCKTNWFKLQNEHYSGRSNLGTPTIMPPEPTTDAEGNIVVGWHLDLNYPVPISWIKSLFDTEMWNVNAALYGSAATAMGPLTYGSTQDDTRKNDGAMINQVSTLLTPPPGSSLVQASNIAQLSATRQNAAVRIQRLCAIPPNTLRLRISATQSPALLQSDDGNDDSDFPLTYECPRYEEIKAHMLKNRHHSQLALDTMEFSIPETTLYAYVLRHGGLHPPPTPLEFRSYLLAASSKLELFIYTPFPGTGTVRRLPTGWPVDTSPVPEMGLPDIKARGIAMPRRATLQYVESVLGIPDMLEALFREMGEVRDMDIEYFGRWIQSVAQGTVEMDSDELRGVVDHMVRSRPDLVTLGPKDILRFTTPIPDSLWANNDFIVARRRQHAKIFREAAALHNPGASESEPRHGWELDLEMEVDSESDEEADSVDLDMSAMDTRNLGALIDKLVDSDSDLDNEDV